jgi:hypothetical protein
MTDPSATKIGPLVAATHAFDVEDVKRRLGTTGIFEHVRPRRS